ncbi:CHAT domain-containing protein [Leptothoe sp. EHU-05/26/07-4]
MAALSTTAGYALPSTPANLTQPLETEYVRLPQAQEAYKSGLYEQARIAWESAYNEFEQSGNLSQQISILNALCNTYLQLGNWQQAEITIQQSIELLAKIDTSQREGILLRAQTLNTQGMLLLAMGQPEEAHILWKQAEELYQQSEDHQGKLGSRINQVQALQSMGLYRQAYLQLVEIQEQVAALPASSLKVVGLKSLGNVFQITGNLQEAQVVLKESIQLAEAIGDQDTISSAWLSLGNAYRGSEVYDMAIQAYAKAAQTASTPLSETVAISSELSLLIKAENWNLVENRLSRLDQLVFELEPNRMGIYAQVNLAISLQTLLQKHRLFEAVPTRSLSKIAQLLATAVKQAQSIDDQRAESYALGQLGALYEYAQQYSHALELTNEALTLSKRLNAKDIDYRWQWQKGRILNAQFRLTNNGNQANHLRTEAISAYKKSVDTLKLIRADLLATDSVVQFSFRDTVELVYRELVDLLVTEDSDESDLRLARQTIEDLQLAELQNFFRSACLDIETQQIDQIDSTAAVIYPVILPDRLLVITSIPGQTLQHNSIPITEAYLNQTVNNFLQALNPVFSKTEQLRVAQTLYQWLIEPLQTTLYEQQIETLVFVLDGSLRSIPIAALHDGERYLVEDFNIALTPGLQLMPPQGLSEEHPNILAGAITKAHQGFSALPGVAQEIDEITEKFPTTVFLNEDFTTDNLQAEVNRNDFPILHLATHGQFSSDLDQTFLLGWEKPLKIKDFQSLIRKHLPHIQQPIELLVLSACQTAEGDDRAALGLAGFAVRSGARSTLATLWSVNDKSTALIISEFYNQLAQQGNTSKAEALRQAQVSSLNNSQYSHPFYWAPFVLVGNWR